MSDSDWNAAMGEVAVLAAEHGLEFWELRNAWANHYCEQGRWPEGEGLGSSDMNHLVYSAVRFDREELAEVAERKGAAKALLASIVEATGQSETLVVQQLRELLRPAAS